MSKTIAQMNKPNKVIKLSTPNEPHNKSVNMFSISS